LKPNTDGRHCWPSKTTAEMTACYIGSLCGPFF